MKMSAFQGYLQKPETLAYFPTYNIHDNTTKLTKYMLNRGGDISNNFNTDTTFISNMLL